jgi:hypothetical protein
MSEPKRIKIDINDKIDPEVRCRNEGADYLAKVNARPVDARIEYNDEDHLYWYDGVLAPISATTAIKKAFDPNDEFDPDEAIDKWFGYWVKSGPKNEHYQLLKQYTDGIITKVEASEAIKAKWSTAGPFGTEMHRLIEIFMNEQAMPKQPEGGTVADRFPTDLTKEVVVEFKQFCDWWKEWAAPRGMVPYRTELSVVWIGKEGRFVCAGQIDGVLKDKDGNYWIFDWKRVKPKKLLTIFEKAWKNARAYMFPDIPATDFHKYSFQASMYSVMMNHSHGIDAGNRLRVVRMHSEIGEAQFIECVDYRKEAVMLLQSLEEDQILAAAQASEDTS